MGIVSISQTPRKVRQFLGADFSPSVSWLSLKMATTPRILVYTVESCVLCPKTREIAANHASPPVCAEVFSNQ